MNNQKMITANSTIVTDINAILNQITKTCLLLKDKCVIPRDPDNEAYTPNPLYQTKSILLHTSYDKIYPKLRNVNSLIGIDSSIYPIAESEDGYVLVTCGTIVVENSINNVNVYRYGPIPIYCSPDSIGYISEIIKNYFRNFSKHTIGLITRNLNYAKRFIILIIESLLLTHAINLAENGSIILVDGTIQRFKELTNLIHKAYVDKEVCIVGISKRSKLYKYFPRVLHEIISSPLPIVIKLRCLPNRYKINNVSVYLGKFNRQGIPLRLDIYDYYNTQIVIDSIFSNSYEPMGYPNVLKEAHIGAKILRSEVIGIKLILSKLGVVFRYSPKFRDLLFGPFNRSSSEWVNRNVNF